MVSAPFLTALSQYVESHVDELATHASGAHALQSALEHSPEDVRASLATVVLSKITSLGNDPHGTYVIQKAFSVAAPEAVGQACEDIATNVIGWSLDAKASFTVASALRTSKGLGLPQTKLLMDRLKPEVTLLATRPWVGRVVLDAMFHVGSAALKEAIREVIFLKCEQYLSEPSRGHKNEGEDGSSGRRTRSSDAAPGARRPPRREQQ